MALPPGTRLGHYEILDLLGAGGMGEVYRARDGKLHREVALKVLPPETAADPERRQRFEREARAVAALNHANIVTIHSVDEAAGQLFLTMELVEGQTLSALIRPGGLPLAQLLDIAVPLADAVSAAHARGITHRDLKPANVMVTPGRQVKVLDFGLAKPFDAGGVTDAMATEAPEVITGQGKILGTVAYMAPEQAEGKGVDARSDIFSLGVMLYEMATGVRPFKGDTSLSTLTAIMRDTPKSVTEVNPAIPKELGRVIRRALSKDPDRRQQTGKDLRNDLDEIRKELESGELSVSTAQAAAVQAAAPVARRTPWVAVAGALALVMAVGAGVVWSRRASTTATPVKAGAPVSVTVTSLTTEDGVETFPSLSPDGKWIVYAADEQRSGQTDIMLRAVGGQTTINLTKDSKANDTQPAFSPDGERIAFRSARDGGGLFVMGRTGESVRRLTNEGFTPSWSPDGTAIVYGSETVTSAGSRLTLSSLWVVSLASGERRRLATADAIQPSWSPHGQRIAYWGLVDNSPQRDLWTVAAGGGEPVRVTNDASYEWSPAWSPDGHYLYFSSDQAGTFNVWRIAIDEATGKPAGGQEPVTLPRQNLGHLSFSADGSLLALSSNTGQSNIEALAFDPQRETVGVRRRITNSSENTQSPSVSSDGKWLAFFRSTNGQEDLWVVGTDGNGLRQLTNDAAVDRRPKWSPDDKRLMFDSTRSGTYQIWTMAPDGGGLTQVTNEPGLLIGGVWSPDGTRAVAYMPIVSRVLLFDPRLPAAQQKVEELPPFPAGIFTTTSWSPDGSRIAGNSSRPGAGLFVYSIAMRAYQELASTGTAPTWLPDSRRLLFALGGNLMLVDSATKVSKQLFSAPRESVNALALSPDAREIYVVINNPQVDIVLAKLTPGKP